MPSVYFNIIFNLVKCRMKPNSLLGFIKKTQIILDLEDKINIKSKLPNGQYRFFH